MKYFYATLIAAAIVLLVSCKSKENQSDILFKDSYQEWFETGNALWEMDNNVLIGSLDSGSGFIMTKDIFKNFTLKLDFYPDSSINSGIFLRCKELDISANDCYEINIWDLHPNQENRTGSVVGKASALQYVETIDKWNTYKLKIQDEHIEAWINGVQTVNYYNHDLAEGYIALQAAGNGEIRFRNIGIMELEQ